MAMTTNRRPQPPTRPAPAVVALLAVMTLLAAACGSDAGSVSAGEPGAVVVSDIGRAAPVADAPVAELAAGFNDAGFDLLRTQPAEENLVFSPISIGHAVLMARGAADDGTGAAIDAAFALPPGMAAHEAWNSLDAAIGAGNGVAAANDGTASPVVNLAGRLWPASTTDPDPAWVDLMASHHGAEVETIDVTRPEEARARVNGWVGDRTNGLIPELVPAGFINNETVLLLTDAVYFKAQWRTVFGKYGPTTAPFTRLDGSTVTVDYLTDLEQPGPRGRGDGFVGAEVPYLGDGYTMLVIVPDEGRYTEIRDRLSADLLAEIDATFTPGPYELRLPEWETTSSIDLLDWLTAIGAAPGAYPGISPGAFLAGGVHAADITVDEVGTEAAAATALVFDESGPPEPELLVAAERPFLYLVRHRASGTVLFAGQVTDPTA